MNFAPILQQLVAHYFASVYLNTVTYTNPKMGPFLLFYLKRHPLLGTEEVRFQNPSEFH